MVIASSRLEQDVATVDDASFLGAVKIEFGPAQLLGRFFLEAERTLRLKGIGLTLGTLADAVATQGANRDTWPSIPPMLDPGVCRAGPANSYCLVGRDRRGKAVTIQAGRVFEGRGSLPDLIASGQFVYGDTARPGSHFRFEVNAPSAKLIQAPFVYSGACWVDPEYRGTKLASVLVRLSRAYALAHWNTDYAFTFVSNDLMKSSVPESYGYTTVEPGVIVHDLPDGTKWYGHFLAIDRTRLLDDLSRYLIEGLAQIDGTVVDRTANQNA